MMYKIIFHPGAFRELGKLPKDVQKRIGKAVDALADIPRPQGCIKLANVEAYRIRVGTYRIIYTIKDDRLVVLVVKIGHRRDVYDEDKTIKQRLTG